MEKSKQVRKLGLHEKTCIEIHETVVNVAHTQNHIYNHEDFKEAVKCLINLHPTLRFKLNDYSAPAEKVEYVYSEDPYIDPVFIKSSNEDDWKQAAIDLANVEFKSDEKSLFRVTLIQFDTTAHILINFHHTIGDGIGGLILTHDLLNFYSKINRKEVFEVVSLPLLENSDTLMFPNGVSSEESKEILELRNTFLDFVSNVKHYVKFNSDPGNFSCRAFMKQGTKENFDAIKSLCKQYKITVGSLVMATSFFAFAKHSTNDWSQKDRLDMYCEVIADMRKRIDPPLKIENFQGIYSFFRLCGVEVTTETKLWDLAKLIYEKNLESLAKKHHFYYTEVMRDIPTNPWPQQNFSMSNLGMYPYDSDYQLNEGILDLSGIHCIGSQFTRFVSYAFEIITVKNICYALIHSSQKNDDYASEVFEEMIKITENSHHNIELTLADILRQSN